MRKKRENIGGDVADTERGNISCSSLHAQPSNRRTRRRPALLVLVALAVPSSSRIAHEEPSMADHLRVRGGQLRLAAG
jgi:hypothetical protein